ncbi:RNA-binding protein [Ahrensia marina]|uniref:DNA-binding protein n=1 Tax=Ahrensia marina TaxID=1514904 RepID=A0A0M9GNV8_9HYPH|nr:RNA-binding protein [Ahrensia marina]KPB01929.1 DNA-binding protein [Ahrensia marina]
MAKGNASDMNDRKCIVTGQSGDAEALMRFVVGPNDQVVPDLKRNLPGRGCWVRAERTYIEQAVAKRLFARGLKQNVVVQDDLPELVDELLKKAALGSLGLARKAGMAIFGSTQVGKAVRAGKALAVLHSSSAAPDGVRKITQARRATVHLGGPKIESFTLFGTEEMDLAFGGGNVIHAAILDAGPGAATLKKLKALKLYRQIADEHDMPEGESFWDEEETDEE